MKRNHKAAMANLRAALAQVAAPGETLTPAQKRTIRQELANLAAEVQVHAEALDQTRLPASFFDPADPRLFGSLAAIALLGQPRQPLASVGSAPFYGSGVYALYYTGPLPIYSPIRSTETPIYVGMAGPAAPDARTPREQGETLCRRLNDHRKNIERASENLRLDDFECRYLVVQTGLQESAEGALKTYFRPIWNKESRVLPGFGKHGDDARTRSNKRSPWDVLHPGRGWAADALLKDRASRAEIEASVLVHFERHKPVANIQHVLEALLSNLRISR